MAEKRDYTAILALVVSVMGAIFSMFQWHRSEMDARASSAIEFSKGYMNDSQELQNQLGALITLSDKVRNTKQNRVGEADLGDPFRIIKRLEYIAFLIHKDMLDDAFIYENIKCDMTAVVIYLAPLQSIPEFQSASVENIKAQSKKYFELCGLPPPPPPPAPKNAP